MEEVHVQAADFLAVEHEGEVGVGFSAAGGGGEGAEDGKLDVLFLADGLELCEVGLRHGEDHALLGFADPDFRRAQSSVLQRGFFEVDDCAGGFTHLADGGGESARAAIGHAVVEGLAELVASPHDGVERLLLGDGVADLHGVRELVGGGVLELGGGEGRAVNAIAAGAAAEGDDQIALLHLTLDGPARHDADAAAVDEGVADIAIVEIHASADGGDAHAVAVIAHTRDDLRQDAAGRQTAGGNVLGVRMGDTEDIGVRDGAGAEAGADDIADAPADAGGRAAVGLDGGGMVVGLDLDTDGVVIVEGDDARVVGEDREGPVHAALDELEGGGGNGALQKIINDDGAIGLDLVAGAIGPVDEIVGGGLAVADLALERLVDAVLGPGLCEGFQFDLTWVAAERGVVLLHSDHLIERKEEVGLAGEFCEVRFAEADDLDGAHAAGVRAGVGKGGGVEGSGVDFLDDGVGEQPRGERSGGILREVGSSNVVPPTGGNLRRCFQSEQLADRLLHGLRDGVHHARERVDLHQM